MGYQAVRLTELQPENTVWICRMCGGSFAVSDIIVEENGGKPLEAVDGVIKTRIKIDEKSSIVVIKKVMELELTDDTKISVVAGLVSDQSGKGFLNG